MLRSWWGKSSLEVVIWECGSNVLGCIHVTERRFLQVRLGSICVCNPWPWIRFKILFQYCPIKILGSFCLLFCFPKPSCQLNETGVYEEMKRRGKRESKYSLHPAKMVRCSILDDPEWLSIFKSFQKSNATFSFFWDCNYVPLLPCNGTLSLSWNVNPSWVWICDTKPIPSSGRPSNLS